MRFFKTIFLLIIFGFALTISFLLFRQSFLIKEKPLPKKTVLFLCVHNTFRSQMAEAYFNKFASEKKINWQAKSAGFLKAEKVNEKAISLMAEEGIDISEKKSKLINEERLKEADKIVVVCRECEEQGLCLNLPKEKDIEYWAFENPAEMELAKAREIRNLIKEKVLTLIETLD